MQMMLAVSLSLLSLAAAVMTLSAVGPILRWKQGKDLSLARGGCASAIFEGKLILAGGTHWKDDQKVWLDEVAAYSIREDRWETMTPLPKPLAYGASAADQQSFYFLGGTGPEKPERAVYRLIRREGNHQWEEFTTLPVNRCFARAVILDGQLFLVGGSENANDLSTASTSLLRLSLKRPKLEWRTLSPMPGEGRAVFAAAGCNGKLFVFGGCHGDAAGKVNNLASAYQYDLKANQWSRLKDVPAPTRAWSASSADNRFVFLFGGYSSSASADAVSHNGGFEKRVYRYDTKLNQYQEVSPLPHPNADMSFHCSNRAFYGAGGEPRQKARAAWTFIGQL